jgi:hypothetical protein
MANFFLMVHSKDSALFKYFCTSVSEALYQLIDGERERVTAHLRKRGASDDVIKKLRRKYWRQRCRWMLAICRLA